MSPSSVCDATEQPPAQTGMNAQSPQAFHAPSRSNRHSEPPVKIVGRSRCQNRCTRRTVLRTDPEIAFVSVDRATVRYRFARPGRGKGRPVVPVTGGRTWTQVRAPAGPQTIIPKELPDQRQLQEHPSQRGTRLTR